MKKLLYFFLTALALTSCTPGTHGDGIDIGNANSNSGNIYAKRIEVPALCDDDIFIAHTTTVNGKKNVTYSISQNPERKHCRWTAFTFDPSNRAKNWNRNNWDNTEWEGDPFQPNPALPDNHVMTKEEINRNGFVRGHIVASADRLYSKDANEQTFFYSNISPMYSSFNTGAWYNCEALVQGWGRNKEFCDTLYIVKGGTIREGEYRSVKSEWSEVECPTVPNYYFMALLCLKDNGYKSIAFLFKHVNGTSQTEVCSIDHLENFTGIDFFCNVPDKVENAIERSYNVKNWSGLYNYIDLKK